VGYSYENPSASWDRLQSDPEPSLPKSDGQGQESSRQKSCSGHESCEEESASEERQLNKINRVEFHGSFASFCGKPRLKVFGLFLGASMIHQLLCAICFQPMDLKKSKSDEDGRPVHEDCYATKMASLDKPKKPHRVSIFGARKKAY
jgi:hypothetical protein